MPLACDQPMSVSDALLQHTKGVEYAHLLEGMSKYPLILIRTTTSSRSPIINGDHTTVTHEISLWT